jgi:DNA-binding NarL/FixJ family response regulator
MSPDTADTAPTADTSRTITLLIVDDHPVVRNGLRGMFLDAPGFEVLGEAADGVEGVRLALSLDPDVVLMDLRMPRCDGVTATRRVRAEHPRTQVVVLTTFAEDAEMLAALRAGARGYLTKDADADEVVRALRRVVSGQADLAPQVQRRLLEMLPRHEPGPPPDSLTDRELQVLRLIAAGLSNTEIAGRLHVSDATVKTHVNHIFAKTGARDRAQAVHYAYQHGLVAERPE